MACLPLVFGCEVLSFDIPPVTHHHEARRRRITTRRWDTGATLPTTVHCATKACVTQCVYERKSGSVAFVPLVFGCAVLSFDLPPPTTTRRGGGGLFLRGGGSLLLRYLSLFPAPLRPVWPNVCVKESQALWPLCLRFFVARRCRLISHHPPPPRGEEEEDYFYVEVGHWSYVVYRCSLRH